MARFTPGLVCIRGIYDILPGVKDHFHQFISVIFRRRHILNVDESCCQMMSFIAGIVIHSWFNLTFPALWETMTSECHHCLAMVIWFGCSTTPRKYIIDRSLTSNINEDGFETFIDPLSLGGLKNEADKLIPVMVTLDPIPQGII